MALPGRSACNRDSAFPKARKCAGSLFFSSLVFDKSLPLREVERVCTTCIVGIEPTTKRLKDRFLSEHERTRLELN
jgi:hypothetical protein